MCTCRVVRQQVSMCARACVWTLSDATDASPFCSCTLRALAMRSAGKGFSRSVLKLKPSFRKRIPPVSRYNVLFTTRPCKHQLRFKNVALTSRNRCGVTPVGLSDPIVQANSRVWKIIPFNPCAGAYSLSNVRERCHHVELVLGANVPQRCASLVTTPGTRVHDTAAVHNRDCADRERHRPAERALCGVNGDISPQCMLVVGVCTYL